MQGKVQKVEAREQSKNNKKQTNNNKKNTGNSPINPNLPYKAEGLHFTRFCVQPN